MSRRKKSPNTEAISFGQRIRHVIHEPKKRTVSECILQGISNVMQKYPGHSIDHFFGDKPMSSAQFFVLNAQLNYEYEQEKKEHDKMNKSSKSKGNRR